MTLNPLDPTSLLLGGLGGLFNFFGQNSQEQQQKDQSQLTAALGEEQRGDTMASQMAQFLMGQQGLMNNQAAQGLASTQLDPYAQAKALNNAQVKAQFAAGWQPGQGFSGSLATPALSPSSLQNSANNFSRYQAAASPNVPTGNPVGDQFQTQYQQIQKGLQDQISQWLQQIGSYKPAGNLNGMYPTMNASTFPSMQNFLGGGFKSGGGSSRVGFNT